MKSGEIRKANQKDVDYLLGTNDVSITDKIENQMAINRAFYNVGKDKKGPREYVPLTRDSQQMSYYFDMDKHTAFMNAHRDVLIYFICIYKLQKIEQKKEKSKLFYSKKIQKEKMMRKKKNYIKNQKRKTINKK